MKKVGLLLLAVVIVALPGCGLTDSEDFYPTPSNMAGVYNLTKMEVTGGGATITRVPPEISGGITLTSVGTYSLDITIPGDHITRSGTYTISEPEHSNPLDPVEDVFVIKTDRGDLWVIGHDGRNLTIVSWLVDWLVDWDSESPNQTVLEFTRS